MCSRRFILEELSVCCGALLCSCLVKMLTPGGVVALERGCASVRMRFTSLVDPGVAAESCEPVLDCKSFGFSCMG